METILILLALLEPQHDPPWLVEFNDALEFRDEWDSPRFAIGASQVILYYPTGRFHQAIPLIPENRERLRLEYLHARPGPWGRYTLTLPRAVPCPWDDTQGLWERVDPVRWFVPPEIIDAPAEAP